jgi:hypothetical protein
VNFIYFFTRGFYNDAFISSFNILSYDKRTGTIEFVALSLHFHTFPGSHLGLEIIYLDLDISRFPKVLLSKCWDSTPN